MPPKFMAKIDSVAKAQNLVDEDSYLNQWKWGDELEYNGTIEETAEIVRKELEEKYT